MARQVDMAFGQKFAQGFRRGLGAGFERILVEADLPVDLGLLALAAPEQVWLQADNRIAAADGSALDGFQQAGPGY